MSYQKQDFANGEVLTASQLNHIEDGIVDVESASNATKTVVDKIIDPTLSLSGKAADAKASGDAIQVVRDDLASEISRAETAEKANADNIATEVERAQAAESTLSTKITEETERANRVENQLKEDVAAITPDDTVVDGKPWASKKIVDSLCMPIEATGNPVQVYPVEGYPLVVKASWEPVQEGEGDPSPDNIRPITGRDAVQVTRCGENLFNKYGLVVGAPVYGEDGVISSYKDVAVAYVKVAPGAQYSIRCRQKDSTTLYLRIAFLTKSKKFIKRAYMIASKSGIESEITFTVSADCEWIQFGLNNGKPFNYNFDVVFVAGSAPTTYIPYTGQTNTLTLPETVYGGEVDAVTEDGKRTWGIIDNYAGETIPREWISDRDVYSADKNPTVGAQVAYRLAEPVPFTATGAQPIPALSGVNTLYTDADGVIVTGAEDPKHTITELKNAIISLGGNI